MMAHHVDAMDVDSDFDNKENSLHHNNVLPFTEKGYEELDVSELNMKLRYSVTPANSPMSKSFTACLDNRTLESGDELNVTVNENTNLTRSLNSTLTKNDNLGKVFRCLPLQMIPADQFDGRNTSVLRPHDSTISDNANVTVTVSGPTDMDENLSLPSSSSSVAHTPEATTPTKDPVKSDGGSPIMRGLKSVLSMFRSSQSPIPPADNETIKPEILSPADVSSHEVKTQVVLASTPIAAHQKKEPSPSKRSSPKEHKESIVFNEDLEKELQWKDETTILFSEERIPIHKLFFQQPFDKGSPKKTPNIDLEEPMNTTVEYMDVSYNESMKDATLTDYVDVNNTLGTLTTESDGEFVDCETTFTKKDDSQIVDNDKTPVNATQVLDEINDNDDENTNPTTNTRLRQIIFNTTQDILDATLSITPEDLLPETLNNSKDLAFTKSVNDSLESNITVTVESNQTSTNQPPIDVTDAIINSTITTETENELDSLRTIENINHSLLDKANDSISPSVNIETEKILDNTTTIENVTSLPILDSTRTLENQFTENILDNTHTIPNDQILEHANDVTSASKTNEYEEVLDDVKIVEAVSSNQPLDKTVDLPDSVVIIKDNLLDSIKPIANITLSHPLLDESVDATSSLNTQQGKPLDSTTQVKNAPIDQPILDQTDNALSVNTEQDKTSYAPKTTENTQINLPVLDQTIVITSLPDPSQPLDCRNIIGGIPSNATMINECVDLSNECANQLEYEESNIQNSSMSTVDTIKATTNQKVVDHHESTLENITIPLDDQNINVIPALETDPIVENNIDANFNKDKPNLNKMCINECKSTIDITLPVMSSHEILQAINEPLSSDAKVNNKASNTELPVDVPFPDDDDIDKEIDDTEVIPTNLPLDLVHTSKNASESREHINKHNEGTEIKIMENFNGGDKATVSTEDLLSANDIFERGNIPIDQRIDIVLHDVENTMKSDKINLTVTEFVPPLHSVHNTIDIPAKCLEDNNPESARFINITTPANSINAPNFNEDVHEFDIKSHEVININNSVCDIKSQEGDINNSVCEFKPLPDIINQTIAPSETQQDVNNLFETIEQTIAKSVGGQHVEEVPLSIENTPELLTEGLAPLTKDLDVVIRGSPDKQTITETVCVSDLDVTMSEPENVVLIPRNEEKPDSPVEMEIDQSLSESLQDKIHSLPTECNNPEERCVEPNFLMSNIPTSLNASSDINTPNNDKTTLECNRLTMCNSDQKTREEEIVVSRNNSPFVSVIAEVIPSEVKTDNNMDIPFVNKTKEIITPPGSPPIASKGYNFNFDEIDDPFATKTKIRESPSLDTPSKSIEPKTMSKTVEKTVSKKDMTRRKSQPAAKIRPSNKRKFNSTFDSNVNVKTLEKPLETIESELQIEPQAPTQVALHIELQAPTQIALHPMNITIEDAGTNVEPIDVVEETFKVINDNPKSKIITEAEDNIEKSIEEPPSEINQVSTESSKNVKEILTPSSSEQSTYYSAGASSSESINIPKNVFNIPEIDDINFNPFVSKSKIRQSPPPDIENPFTTKSNISNSPNSSITIQQEQMKVGDKMDTEFMEKETAANLSSATTSSKTTVKTEDEDTIEGPFLEAEDLNDEFFGENINDMMNFNDIPRHANEQIADTGEMFIDAEAFEFLLNQNKSNTVADSGKESLFLKFDPLFAKRMSAITPDSVLAALSKIQKQQSTPTKAVRSPPKEVLSPIPGPSSLNIPADIGGNASEETNDELNITVSKPMMVVPPAVNPVTPRNKSWTSNTPNRSLTPNTPNRSNRRSLTFTSPAMAVIDRLLSLSGNNSHAHDTTVNHVSREQHEADLALTQLRELLAEKEINVYNLRSESRELQGRLSAMESQMKNLEIDGQQRLKKINELNEKLAEKTRINKSMAAVVEEYEQTIVSLIAETAQDKKRHAEERMKLISERDEQTAHLASMEVSFSDLHSKYEKIKQVIFNCKANEDAYKKTIKEFEENLSKMQNNYELLKQHATSKLNHANSELEKINKTHESEVLKLNAMIKRKDLHITSLEETLLQKTKANEELTAICDELINKVG